MPIVALLLGRKLMRITTVTWTYLSRILGANYRHNLSWSSRNNYIIRWKYLRATEGWNSLQFHSVLHTTVTVTPKAGSPFRIPPRLLVQLQQGSLFAILPRETNKDFMPEWHTGNIYGMRRSHANVVDLPGVIKYNGPMTFDLFVSGDYEVGILSNFSCRDTSLTW